MRREIKSGRKFLRRLGIKLIAVAIVLIGAILLIDVRIRPIIEKTSSYQSRILATRIINEAVYEEINDENYAYVKLVDLTTNSNGEVTSIACNMVNINRLKTQVTQDVNEAIKSIENHDLGISLGTASGVHILYGQGPVIPIRVAPKGYVKTTLISKFSDAGINQTLHQIVMVIAVDISAIIPGYTTSVTVEADFVVAETVIVGTVPSSYTHVVTGDSDLAGLLNDYNASEFYD